MSRFSESSPPPGADDWITYDQRIEALIQLRSDSENQRLSAAERDDAFEAAGKYAPTLEEWTRCRQIAERRHTISRARRLAKQHRPSPPLSVVSREEPPKPDVDLKPVSPERAKRLLRNVFDILVNGGTFPKQSPVPPARFVRTDFRYADQYWYQVGLERRRRAWMTARKLEYVPRLAIHLEDLDRERP